MKNIYVLVLILFPFITSAQTTPALGPVEHPTEGIISSSRAFGDTIDFNDQISGAIITNQYAASNGAIFSGAPVPNYADIYDYVGLYGPILKSSTWFDIVRLDFVDPNDITVAMPICHFGYLNPIDSEVDYITAKFYDINDNLIYSHTSISPQEVTIDLGAATAAYVLFDDSLDTAYVLDNIWFATGCPVSVDEVEAAMPDIYPNPASSMITIDPRGTFISSVQITDVAGRVVMNIPLNTAGKIQVDISSLTPGIYQVLSSADNRVIRLVIE